jgi:hypothetical protein
MFDSLRETWVFLKRGPPGERFLRYCQRHREHRRARWQRPARLGGGTIIVLVGIVLLPAPGPGTLVIAAGAALVAGESRGVAHLLDRIELRGRRLLAAWRRR